MEGNVLDFAQYIDITKPPFRKNILDYSHLEYADILDAVGSTALMLMLSALFLQFPSLAFGFSTRALGIRTLFERSLIPNAVSAMSTWLRSPGSKQKFCFLISTFAISGTLQLLLLGMEATIVFFSTQREYGASFEELNFKSIQFSNLNDTQNLVQWPQRCVSFWNSNYSIVIPKNSFCFCTDINFHKSKRSSKLSFGVQYEPTKGSLILNVTTDVTTLIKPIVNFEPKGPGNETIGLNMTLFVADPKLFTEWVGQYFARQFKCTVKCSNSSVFSYCSIDDCALGDDEEITKKIYAIIFSSMKLSDRLLTRRDFLVLRSDYENSTSSDVFDYEVLPTSIDWDNFIHYQTSRVPGYWLWMGAVLLFIVNLFVASIAPDIQLVKAVAVAQSVQMTNLPLHTCRHMPVCLPRRKGIVWNYRKSLI